MSIKNETAYIPQIDTGTLTAIQTNFYNELMDAQAGKQTSLTYILHTLPHSPIVQEGEKFQIMVIGGSVFKYAIARKDINGLSFSDVGQCALPLLKSKNDLFTFIEKYLDQNTRVISLNFAYPLKPIYDNGRLDGVLMSATKEHIFAGLTGERVGQSLEKYLQEKYKKQWLITAANDTICLLLSGNMLDKRENLACGIVGTGNNFAFFTDENSAVNLESANFDKFTPSAEALLIDQESGMPGRGLFEKETAGAYLYQHFNLILKKNKIDYPALSSTWELKKLALKDQSTLSKTARALIEKSAGFVAALAGGIMLYKRHDMTFIMEGSMFWDGDIYKESVEKYLAVLAPQYKANFIEVKNSHFIGASMLVYSG